jgi:hypothetical protein
MRDARVTGPHNEIDILTRPKREDIPNPYYANDRTVTSSYSFTGRFWNVDLRDQPILVGLIIRAS